MANTSKLKEDVEDWYRESLNANKKDKKISKQKVDLIWGGTFEFDAVVKESDNNIIVEVHCLSTSKYNTGQLHKIKDDALMLTGVRHSIKKVIAFTDSTLHQKVESEQKNGRFPTDIDLIPLNVPEKIKNIIIQVKTDSITEQKYKQIK